MSLSLWRSFVAVALAVARSNPKSIRFFTAVFPQFLSMRLLTGVWFMLIAAGLLLAEL